MVAQKPANRHRIIMLVAQVPLVRRCAKLPPWVLRTFVRRCAAAMGCEVAWARTASAGTDVVDEGRHAAQRFCKSSLRLPGEVSCQRAGCVHMYITSGRQ